MNKPNKIRFDVYALRSINFLVNVPSSNRDFLTSPARILGGYCQFYFEKYRIMANRKIGNKTLTYYDSDATLSSNEINRKMDLMLP